MSKLSLRGQLRLLWIQHPDWTYAQYAAAIGQGVDSVRAAAHAMKLKRHQPPPAPEPKVIKLPPQKKKPVAPKSTVAGSTRITSSTNAGYRRLL